MRYKKWRFNEKTGALTISFDRGWMEYFIKDVQKFLKEHPDTPIINLVLESDKKVIA